MTLDDIRDRATITVDEAAAVLGIDRSTAYAAVHNGDLPHIRIGRRILVPVPKFLRMFQSSDAQPSG